MDELMKQFIYNRLTPPNHIMDLVDFIEEMHQQGNITSQEYNRLLNLLNDYLI